MKRLGKWIWVELNPSGTPTLKHPPNMWLPTYNYSYHSMNNTTGIVP